VIALSGTPILNRPVEFWSILSILRPDVFFNKMGFMYRYCGARRTPWGWDFKGATNTIELNEILSESVMLRKRKEDVLKDLPDKIFNVVTFDGDLKDYRANESRLYGMEGPMSSFLAEFNKLRTLAFEVKKNAVVKWIQDFIDTGTKLVVFAVHHKTIDFLMDKFHAVKIDGRVSMKDRQKAIERFQVDDNVMLFVGNIEAAGVGIDGLQNVCSNVAFVELPWVPGSVDQASDRVHRIGTKDSVSVYYLIAEGTIEEDIAKALDSKREVLRNVLDGKEADENSLIKVLMQKFKRNVA